MSAQISLEWKEGVTFETVLDGHTIMIDKDRGNGGRDEGPRPKALMLVALAGCSAMDIIPLFNKMRVRFTKVTIDVDAGTSDTIPMVYTSFHMTYHIEGHPEDAAKMVKAIRLSQEKYCGVGLIMKKIAPITYEIRLNGNNL